jgi:hypothetical protein
MQEASEVEFDSCGHLFFLSANTLTRAPEKARDFLIFYFFYFSELARLGTALECLNL